MQTFKKAILSVTKFDYGLTYNSKKRFNRSSLKNAIPNLTKSEYDRIIQKKEKYYKYFIHETKLNRDIADILFKYSKSNKTVLVTNCRKERAMITLKYFGLDNKFGNIFCRENQDNELKINKFKNAILKLGISPDLIIAFENEESEIAEAKEAGIRIINPRNL